MSYPDNGITIVPGTSLPDQSWWPQLHTVIIESFRNKKSSVYPPTWTRLDPDPVKGAAGLSKELGADGHYAVLISNDGVPVAGGGVLPYRGDNWINEAFSKSDKVALNPPTTNAIEESTAGTTNIPDWEVCCFCVHPSERGKGHSTKLIDALLRLIASKGAQRLFSNYAVDETGNFWSKLGFELVPAAGGMLPIGFKVDPQKEGLRANVYFKMGVKMLQND